MISPFTPLQFYYAQDVGGITTFKGRFADFDVKESDGIASRYVQTFSRTDNILIQFIAQVVIPTFLLIQEDVPNQWEIADRHTIINSRHKVYFPVLHGLSPGYYHVEILGYKLRSNTFRITDDEAELAKTTLIQYSMKDNRQRTDTFFLINGMRHFFDFRVPGGFKAGDTTFGCENEQFKTQQGDICTLYSIDTVLKKFTLGSQIGVPVWFAEMLNRLLTCTYVYFDGVRYERKDGSTPEVNVQMEGLDSFVYKIQLQKVSYLNPTIENDNLAIIRRTAAQIYRATDNNHNRIIS